MDRNITIKQAIAGGLDSDLVKRFAAKHEIEEDLVRPSDVAGGRKAVIEPGLREKFLFDVHIGLTLAQIIERWREQIPREKTADNWQRWAKAVLGERKLADPSESWVKKFEVAADI